MLRAAVSPIVVSRVEEDAETLRARFQEYGYLYFKNYVAEKKCDALLNEFLTVLEPHIGFDQKGRHPVLNGEPFFETDEIWGRLLGSK